MKKDKLIAALHRSGRTAVQAMLAAMGFDVIQEGFPPIWELDWLTTIGIGLTAAVVALGWAYVGKLPEVDE